MNDDQIVEYLRSRGRGEPPLDLVSSVMDAVDRAPQRRSWFAAFVPALAAAGAVAVTRRGAYAAMPTREDVMSCLTVAPS